MVLAEEKQFFAVILIDMTEVARVRLALFSRTAKSREENIEKLIVNDTINLKYNYFYRLFLYSRIK